MILFLLFLLLAVAHHGGFRWACLEVQIFRYPTAPDLLGATVEPKQCSIVTWGQKKGPGEVVAGADSPASH